MDALKHALELFRQVAIVHGMPPVDSHENLIRKNDEIRPKKLPPTCPHTKISISFQGAPSSHSVSMARVQRSMFSTLPVREQSEMSR